MSSEVWKYFTIDVANPNYAKCKFCSKLLSRGGASKSTSNMTKHLQTKHKPLLSPKLGLSQPIKGKKTETQTVQSDIEKPSTSTSKSVGTLNFFVKPKPVSSGLIGDHGHGLGPNSEEMDLDDDLIEQNITPRPIDEPLSINTGDPETGLLDSENITSPESTTTNVSTFSDIEIQSPVLPSQECSQSPVLYPKAIKIQEKKQTTIQGMYERKIKFKSNDPRATKIDSLIAEMICLDLQPISIVEDEGFLKLLNHLEPRYNVPSRKTFSSKILINMYKKVQAQVKSDLLEAKHVAITTDMWTSVANCDFMAVTAHFFCAKTNTMVHKCLECVPFPEISHTAINILNFLTQVFKEWEIENSVVGIVRDNGADITAALNISKYEAYPCVAHTLQLVIKDGCMDHSKISNVVKKAKKLVGNFKKSSKNTKILKSLQKQLNLPEHRLIQEEATRWNTTFYMLKRLVEQKDALILMSGKPEVSLSVELTSDDFKTMKFAVEMLEIFENATRQVSKESSTISEVSHD